MPQNSFGQQMPQQQSDQISGVLYISKGATVYNENELNNVKIVKVSSIDKHTGKKPKIFLKTRATVFVKNEVKNSYQKFTQKSPSLTFKFAGSSSDQNIQNSGSSGSKISVNANNYSGKAILSNSFSILEKVRFYALQFIKFRDFSKTISLSSIASIRPPPVV